MEAIFVKFILKWCIGYFWYLTVKFWPGDLFQPQFDRHILTPFKNSIGRMQLETYKSLVDQRWSLVISSMRIFIFYCYTSSYSHMLPFYFLLLGVSPNPKNPNVSYVLLKTIPSVRNDRTASSKEQMRLDKETNCWIQKQFWFNRTFPIFKSLNAQVLTHI